MDLRRKSSLVTLSNYGASNGLVVRVPQYGRRILQIGVVEVSRFYFLLASYAKILG